MGSGSISLEVWGPRLKIGSGDGVPDPAWVDARLRPAGEGRRRDADRGSDAGEIPGSRQCRRRTAQLDRHARHHRRQAGEVGHAANGRTATPTRCGGADAMSIYNVNYLLRELLRDHAFRAAMKDNPAEALKNCDITDEERKLLLAGDVGRAAPARRQRFPDGLSAALRHCRARPENLRRAHQQGSASARSVVFAWRSASRGERLERVGDRHRIGRAGFEPLERLGQAGEIACGALADLRQRRRRRRGACRRASPARQASRPAACRFPATGCRRPSVPARHSAARPACGRARSPCLPRACGAAVPAYSCSL